MKSDHEDLVGAAEVERDLYTTLYEHLPNHRKKEGTELDIPKLAQDLKMTRQGIDFWFLRKSLPPKRCKKLIALDGSTLTPEILLPFLMDD